jgi:hypothetical protein
MARLSCLTAVIIFLALQLRMLLTVHDSLPAPAQIPELLAVMIAATSIRIRQLWEESWGSRNGLGRSRATDALLPRSPFSRSSASWSAW